MNEEKYCEHLKKVVMIMEEQNIRADGDTQVCALKCDKCNSSFYF